MRAGANWRSLSPPLPFYNHYRTGPASRAVCDSLASTDPVAHAALLDFLGPAYAARRADIWRWLTALPYPPSAWGAETLGDQDVVDLGFASPTTQN